MILCQAKLGPRMKGLAGGLMGLTSDVAKNTMIDSAKFGESIIELGASIC